MSLAVGSTVAVQDIGKDSHGMSVRNWREELPLETIVERMAGKNNLKDVLRCLQKKRRSDSRD
jgi:hypothetical protein